MLNTDTLGPFRKPWLLPVLLAQGQLIRIRARHLPEPPGERRGRVDGQGQAWRVLAVGDSAAVAVGAPCQEAGLAPSLAREYAARTGRPVEWAVAGRTGLDAAGCLARLDGLLESAGAAGGGFDLVVTSVGANDVFGLTGSGKFAAGMGALLARLAGLLAADGRIVVSRAPPFHCSPLFREPLRGLVEWRTDKINSLLTEAAERCRRAIMATGPIELEPRDFATDGVHPNAASYGVWAAHMLEMSCAD